MFLLSFSLFPPPPLPPPVRPPHPVIKSCLQIKLGNTCVFYFCLSYRLFVSLPLCPFFLLFSVSSSSSSPLRPHPVIKSCFQIKLREGTLAFFFTSPSSAFVSSPILSFSSSSHSEFRSHSPLHSISEHEGAKTLNTRNWRTFIHENVAITHRLPGAKLGESSKLNL